MLHLNFSEKFQLPNGKTVYVPNSASRALGTRLKKLILRRWRPPRYFYHMQKGGHVAAAKCHLNNNMFYKCDLTRCFDHVNRSKLHRALKASGFAHDSAWYLSGMSTVEKYPGQYSIPFGFVQSPILASLVMHRSILGSTLSDLVRSGIALSLYVDDILLSCSDRPDLLRQAGEMIAHAASRAGFAINPDKCSGPCDTVNVFNLALRHGSLTVADPRMALFEEAVLSGSPEAVHAILGYVGTVNRGQANHLAAVWRRTHEEQRLQPAQ